jgi:hypothetical protein
MSVVSDFLIVPDKTTKVCIENLNKIMRIYPTPASDNINIEFEISYDNISAKLVNYLGVSVANYSGSGTKLNIDTGNLTPGLYFISVESGSVSYKSIPVLITK